MYVHPRVVFGRQPPTPLNQLLRLWGPGGCLRKAVQVPAGLLAAAACTGSSPSLVAGLAGAHAVCRVSGVSCCGVWRVVELRQQRLGLMAECACVSDTPEDCQHALRVCCAVVSAAANKTNKDASCRQLVCWTGASVLLLAAGHGSKLHYRRGMATVKLAVLWARRGQWVFVSVTAWLITVSCMVCR